MVGGPSLSRSVYVSRLRRAFLLQAHPDRFRAHSPTVQRQQAELLQAIAGRLTQPDILHYYQNNNSNNNSPPIPKKDPKYLEYFLICGKQKDELIPHRVNIHDSVSGFVQSLRDALQRSGHPFPSPPNETTTTNAAMNTNTSRTIDDSNPNISWIYPPPNHKNNNDTNRKTIDHRYDIHSNHGRNLSRFLESVDPWDIEKRQANRLDVIAAAFMVREAFSFSSVNGTGLGWSSAALARLLRTLLALHHEHSHHLSVASFYPLQLFFSSSIDHTTRDDNASLDLHGGILYLSPASTPIQWLDHHLRHVTAEQLELHARYKSQLKEYSDICDQVLQVKFVKGYSCSSPNYHEIMKRLATEYHADQSSRQDTSSESALTLERVFCRVESSSAVRRGGQVTKDGQIQISDGMSPSQIATSIRKLLPQARQRLGELRQHQLVLKEELVPALQREFGILKIQKSKIITWEQHVASLHRLLQHLRTSGTSWKQKLAGNSLNIVGKGHYCHLGDDGTFEIPWDWT